MALEVPQHRTNTSLVEGGGVVAASTLEGLCHATPVTFDLGLDSLLVDLDEPSPFPLGWQKFLNLKTGRIYYKKESVVAAHEMSRRNPKLDLKLNLSPPRGSRQMEDSPHPSPPSSCLSSETGNTSSPETTSMVLVGCPRCLMYVMLSEEDDPKCPKCKSTVLIDFLNDTNKNKNNNNNKTKKTRKS